MHVVVWEFQVKGGAEDRFEAMYGPSGAWMALFAEDPEWLGTELLRDGEDGRRYLTIDRWRSARSYDHFLAARGEQYRRIDDAGEGLTETETLIGRFEIDAPVSAP